jgi:hypothetical protein
MPARIAAFAALLLTPVLLPEPQHVVSDSTADFASLKTFSIREGRATTRRPELNNKLLFDKVEAAIRTQLLSKGLTETDDRPDMSVGFTVGEDRPNGPSVTFNQGTLVIDITARDTSKSVWQGVYRDGRNSSPAKVAEKLPDNVKKLLSAYPPKKKK